MELLFSSSLNFFLYLLSLDNVYMQISPFPEKYQSSKIFFIQIKYVKNYDPLIYI